MNELSDSRLLAAWRAGDVLAGDTLLSRHFAPLRKFLLRRAGSEADEILQRTFLACTASCQRIRDESTFRTYLFTIARHELYRFSRQRAALEQFVSFDECVVSTPARTSIAEELVHAESLRALQAALTALRESDRALLRSFYGDELDSPTLAAKLGIKPTAVRARLKRARAELEDAMQQWHPTKSINFERSCTNATRCGAPS